MDSLIIPLFKQKIGGQGKAGTKGGGQAKGGSRLAKEKGLGSVYKEGIKQLTVRGETRDKQ